MKVALGLYDEILRADPCFALVYADRATAFAMMKEYDVAIQELERAFALGYTAPSAYCTAGTICLQTQHYEQGLAYYAKAIAHVQTTHLRTSIAPICTTRSA